MPLKVLSRGEVTAKVSIEAHRFSAAAAEKITKAGGTVKALEG
jgi:large subunit ribosomal protein L15